MSALPSTARNLVVVVLDSLRYDRWLAAPLDPAGLGQVERRWSYASWTAPSHYNLLMGLLPHTSPPRVYASEYYKQDFFRYPSGSACRTWSSRAAAGAVPAHVSKHPLGYTTHARVSMPVLNKFTPINRDFDSYELMPTHNDMAAMVEELHFDDDRPSFWLLNVGETHYPYARPGQDSSDLPHISGVHGSSSTSTSSWPGAAPRPSSSPARLKSLHERQVAALEYLDGVFARLLERLPANTWLIVTSDHGELFGEDGYFGHGPIAHERCSRCRSSKASSADPGRATGSRAASSGARSPRAPPPRRSAAGGPRDAAGSRSRVVERCPQSAPAGHLRRHSGWSRQDIREVVERLGAISTTASTARRSRT